MQRSSVLLPEPDAPIRQMTSTAATSRSMPSSTRVVAEALHDLGAARSFIAPLVPVIRRRSRGEQVVGEPRERDRHAQEQHRGDDVGREVEVTGGLDARPPQRLDRPEDADQGDVLLQADEVVHQRRHDPTHGLGEHDVAHRLAVRQAERAGGGALALVDALDAGAEHLGDVGRVGR